MFKHPLGKVDSDHRRRTLLAHPTAVMTKAASEVEHSIPRQSRQETARASATLR
jgi:hypothetical protein